MSVITDSHDSKTIFIPFVVFFSPQNLSECSFDSSLPLHLLASIFLSIKETTNPTFTITSWQCVGWVLSFQVWFPVTVSAQFLSSLHRPYERNSVLIRTRCFRPDSEVILTSVLSDPVTGRPLYITSPTSSHAFTYVLSTNVSSDHLWSALSSPKQSASPGQMDAMLNTQPKKEVHI